MSHYHMHLAWNGIPHKLSATPFVGVAFLSQSSAVMHYGTIVLYDSECWVNPKLLCTKIQKKRKSYNGFS